ncbi:transposase [Pacificimonas sp. WHA3]|uniref:Transposase n=1 Tax=Pacificimonas pallii TaxID=2827236 RepID=A0ABS6SEY1_9SPHN|nr:transposase [Pacificimonas pallii]MBV7256486.1 transposase [Pacificimonas pallii]
MARLARIVVPHIAHHVTQRGNRRQQVFFSADDSLAYIEYLHEGLTRTKTTCLAWCLMPNHVHLILVPTAEDGLRAALGEAHRRYSRRVNFREGWRGYLWQGRFASYPMDEAHVRNAILYVERNPVAAGLAARAEDWRWSSARARVAGTDDPLADLDAVDMRGLDWSRELAGWDAEQEEGGAHDMDAHLRTGRPLGDENFVARLEAATGRTLAKRKRGPKPAG